MSIKSRVAAGFTIVEIMVVLSILGVLIAIVFGTLADFYESNNKTIVSTVQNGDAQTALRLIEKDVSTAAGFLTANAVADPTRPAGWSHRGVDTANPNNRILILSSYATTNNSNTRALLFATGSCSQPLTNNLVYFVDAGVLYRRTIKNTATPCGGLTSGQKQSCAATVTNVSCQAVDAKLMVNVTEFSIDYYVTPTDSTPYSDAYGTNPTSTIESSTTKTVNISITSSQRTGGSPTTATNSFRVTRQN